VFLLGLAERLRETVGAPRESVDRARFALYLEEARAALPDGEFGAAWEHGRSLLLDDLLGDPLEAVRMDGLVEPSGAPNGPLTPREHEVAVLVARGLTNRQVAEELVIAPGTARVHVERILGKLQFSSRRQLTTWAIERGLLATGPG
jgi:DNA-binding CsgD family transcriptional regulator